MKRHFRALGVPLFLLLTVVLEVFVMEGTALCQASQRDLDALSKASVIYIATVRKDGNQSKPAPVWFTFTPDGQIYIQTRPDRWQAKSVRRGSPMIGWIGSPNRPRIYAQGQIATRAFVLALN